MTEGDPTMSTATSLPAMPHGITPEWLTGILHAAGVPEDAHVISIRHSRVGDGVGMMSELSRLNLTWSRPGPELHTTLIAKYSSSNPINRQAANGFHVYEREVRFYEEVLDRTTARTPCCHFARLEGDNHLLLLEDLGDYRIGSQAVGATLADARLAIDELARLHAPFWGHVDDLTWVPHIASSYHAETMRTMAIAGWDNMVNVFARHFTDTVIRSRDRILAAIPAAQARMDSAPVTFTHGDFRMDNLLFGTRPDQFPIITLDWQGPLLSRGVVDVALLLGQNTLVEVRREHERRLLQAYVDGLSALGVDYPIALAWEHYLDALAYQWCYAATVTGSLDSSNPRSKAWMSQLIARQVAATEDHQLLQRLDTFG